MKNRNKEYIAIGLFLVLAVGAFFGVKMLLPDAETITNIEVRYKDEVLQTIDLSKDGVYEIEVTLGHLYVHVENEEYWVQDVDCPDKICEKFGKVKKGSSTIIACLPNNIVLVQV